MILKVNLGLRIQAFVLTDSLYIVLAVPPIDKGLPFEWKRLHYLPLVHPAIQKSFQYDLSYKYLAIQLDVQYITFPYEDDILRCTISVGHFCRLNTAHYPVYLTHDCSFYLFKNDMVAVRKYCRISLINHTIDRAIRLDENFWVITTVQHRKLYITCLTYLDQQALRYPFDIIYLLDSCEASTKLFFLPSNDTLTNEVTSRDLST